MFNTMHKMILLFILVGGILQPGMRQVSGMMIYTVSSVEAVRGTDVKLSCIFSSSSPVSPRTVTVTWSFRPLHPGREQSVLFYYGNLYLPQEGRFKGRVAWLGDVMKNDASIILKQVSPAFEGTYSCRVLNPPDVHGRDGEVVLSVVNQTASLDPSDWFMALFDTIGAGLRGVV